ncbi:hypothetical protein [Lactobacillus intestinalis]|uniref:hypothetical protein n=1 Tax=Lactobacillus intestinalis TaxID=151781 RepID=UPI001F597172|nr:hypothetical protein [Lactobacillus intestinalis]
MIKVLARNNELTIIAVNYCFFGVKNDIVVLVDLSSLTKPNSNFKYGDFTSEYSKETLNIWEKQAQLFIAEYKTDLKEYGLPKDKIGWYIKNRYNQILKSFNEAIGYVIYPNQLP